MTRLLLGLMLALASAATSLAAQSTAATDSTPPQFVRLSSDSSRTPEFIDASRVPALARSVEMHIRGATRHDALTILTATANLHIAYADALVGSGGSITIQSDAISVAGVLARVLTGTGIDVAVSGRDNIVLVRRRPPPAQPDTSIQRMQTLAPIQTIALSEQRKAFALATTMSHLELETRDLSSAPTLFEPDLLRTVQLLPGVESRNDYSTGLNVRGGESDQNLILLDGYPIYNPFHLGGLLGTFIDPMVGSVSVMTGAEPPRFGERLSSVLDVRSAEETRTGLHGSADVSLLAATASVGSALDGGGSWMLGARHTYADVIANLVRPNSLPYHFQDLQGHVSIPVLNGALLSVTGYDGDDASSLTNNKTGLGVQWGNRVLGATLSRTFDGSALHGLLNALDSLALVQRASATMFDASAILPDGSFNLSSSVRDLRASGSATMYAGSVAPSFGYEVSAQRFSYSMTAPLTMLTNFLPPISFVQSPTAVSGWADVTWKVTSAFTTDIGVRLDAVSGTGWSGVSPRVSLRYQLSPDFALIAASGSYAQWQHTLGQDNAPLEPVQFWVASSRALGIPVSTVWQSSGGFEAWSSDTRQYRVDLYVKQYGNLVETNPAASGSLASGEFTPVSGRSYGADVLLRQVGTASFSGWIAYSYGVNDRVTADGVHFSPAQDRRHALNAVGSWRTEHYQFSARLGLATGAPYTPITGEFTRERYDPLGNGYSPDVGGGDMQYLSGPLNSARYPFSERLDVNLTRLPARGARVQVSPFVSIANVFNASNPALYIYSYSASPPTRYGFPNLPFLPTVGVHIAY